MASLNLSTNGASISNSYQSIVNAGPPASNSPTVAQWAVFSVSAPLVNAFQSDAGGKESVLKLQTSGAGELADLVDEFSDGKVQFAFVKVKDPNTTLPKYVLIGWCGEGVPERTKGYFTSHQAAVEKVLHGYHVQITARSDRDLTPEGIVQKVADSSGSKYSAANQKPAGGPPPPVATKPVFMPTQSGSGGSGFNPLGGSRKSTSKEDVDEDGWGKDAPQVTRTQLEKVQSAYQPTKVNMRELSSRPQEPLKFPATQQRESGNDDVVKGAYQPIGKVDIAAIRRQAQEGRLASDDRPTTVKGSYEPVGKVDIAAIRARAQQPTGREDSSSARDTEQPKSLPDRSSAFTTSERLTSLPKPKVGNKFGSAAGTFGTKAPTPGGFGLDSKTSPSVPPVGASRTFADDGGRTPAQQWAEKKAKGGGNAPSQPSPSSFGVKSPIAAQTSGGEGWKSGYTGKSWATVQTSKPGHQAPAHDEGSTAQEAEPPTLAGDVGAMREMFKSSDISDRTPPGPPPLDTSNKPIARGVPIPGLFSQPSGGNEAYSHPKLPNPPPQPRSPTPPTPERSDSPIRVVKPVSNSQVPEVEDAHEEQYSPPPTIPVRSMAETVSQYAETPAAEESAPRFPDTGRAAGAAVAAATFGHETAAAPGAELSGKRALIQYDYEKAEDNELELREGEYVTNINMVDEDWWHGENQRGQSGLFPSNYVELVEDDGPSQQAPATTQAAAAEPAPGPAGGAGAVATALYDYEAAEDNELSFPEGAKISNVEFPDEDWWSGVYGGKEGLFPANYVQLDG